MPAPKLSLRNIFLKSAAMIAVSMAVAMPSVGAAPRHAIAQPHTTASKEIDLTPFSGTAFRPPRRTRRRSGYRTTTGTRRGGCLGNTETAFSLLAPSANIGMSASGRPLFVWHLPETQETFPVRLRLLAPGADGIPEPVHTAGLSYTAGLMTYELPQSVPPLSPNKEYRWQVVIVCDESYPSRSMVQELSVAVEPPSGELTRSLTAATTTAERALAYGQAGFWYDAIAQVIGAADPQERAMLKSLIEDLAATETENEQISEDLLEIAQTVN